VYGFIQNFRIHSTVRRRAMRGYDYRNAPLIPFLNKGSDFYSVHNRMGLCVIENYFLLYTKAKGTTVKTSMTTT
jgi:hypothetical protein